MNLDAQVDALMFLLQVAMLERGNLSVLSVDIERAKLFSPTLTRMNADTLAYVI